MKCLSTVRSFRDTYRRYRDNISDVRLHGYGIPGRQDFWVKKRAIYLDLYIVFHSFFCRRAKQQCTIYHKKCFISGNVGSVYFNRAVFYNGVNSFRNL